MFDFFAGFVTGVFGLLVFQTAWFEEKIDRLKAWIKTKRNK